MKKIRVVCALVGAFALFLINFPAYAATSTADLTYNGLISEDTILTAGHQCISEKYKDSPNVIEYENADGTRTAYLFNEPIKYTDEDGVVKQIDSQLNRSILDNSWKNAANWFGLSISNDISQGITLSCYDATFVAVPVAFENTASFTREKGNLFESEALRFINNSEEIAYKSTNSGYYTIVTLQDKSTFSLDISGNIAFWGIDSDRVTFTMTNGCTAVYSLAEIYINDQYNASANVQVSVVTVAENSYRLTYSPIVALTKEAQLINIVIEATVNAASTTQASVRGSETVPLEYYKDATVYSNYPSNNYGTAIRCLVGVDGTMGKSRSYFKFDLSYLTDIPYNRILSANYRIRELTGYDSSFQAVAFIIQDSWSETGVTWNNRPDCFDEKLGVVNVDWAGDASGNNRAYYDFYITSAVMAWLQGVPNNGIMVMSRVESEVNCRAFASREYGSYIPRLSITYSTETQSMDNIGITDGAEYYIKNKNSMLYLTASGSAAGSSIVQKPWTGASKQKWKVEFQDNYYVIHPGNAPKKVLDAVDGSNTNNTAMQVASPTSSNSQKFKFIRNWDGSYQIVTRKSSKTRGLCALDNNTDDGGTICHRNHTINWVKSDDWTLEPVVKNKADIFCFTGDNYEGLDTTENVADMVASLNAMGYDSDSKINHPCSGAYNCLSSNSIWIFSGHGGATGVWFKGEYNLTAVISSNTNFPVANKPHNDLAGLNLAYFASCETGLDDTANNTNMVGLTYQKGAHFVIAHTDNLYDFPADEWLQVFLDNCKAGKTIYQAMSKADSHMYSNTNWAGISYGNTNQRHVLGDNSLCLYQKAS